MASTVTTPLARYESLWTATVDLPTYTALDRNLVTDVVIVGAGIAGMSVAYHLARAGCKVVVLDDGPVASGITRRTTAHLTCAMDNTYQFVESRRGTEGARLAASSHRSAIDRIEKIVEHEGIECDFQRLDAYLFLPPGEKVATLQEELAAAGAGRLAVSPLGQVAPPFFPNRPLLRLSPARPHLPPEDHSQQAGPHA